MIKKIETFNLFNKGRKRKDRKRHLELCGFDLCHVSFDRGCSPRELAERYCFIEGAKAVHVVYLVGGLNAWGYPVYLYYRKGVF